MHPPEREVGAPKIANPVKYPRTGPPVKRSQNNPLRPKGATFCRQNVSFIAKKLGKVGDTQMEFLFAVENVGNASFAFLAFVNSWSEGWRHFILRSFLSVPRKRFIVQTACVRN